MLSRHITRFNKILKNKRFFSNEEKPFLSHLYYHGVFEKYYNLNEIQHHAIQQKDEAGKVVSTIDLYGIPIEKLSGTDENTVIHPDLQKIMDNQDHQLTFVQYDPTKYLYWRRKLAKLLMDSQPQSEDLQKYLPADPLYPVGWEETIIDKEVLRYQARVNHKKSKDDIDNKEELAANQLADYLKSVFDTIMDRNSLYYEINNVLMTELLLDHEVVLGGMPKTLQRLIVGNSLSLANIQELFKLIVSEFPKLKRNDLSLGEACQSMYPDLFLAPQDIYMTLFLKDIQQKKNNFRAFVGINHYKTILDLWDQDMVKNTDLSQVLGMPDKLANDTIDTLLEKHAILEVMFDKNTWNSPYIKNPFPYLVTENQNLNENDMSDIKKKYDTFIKQYSDMTKPVKAK